ncbi:hypothetical protein NP234_24875, partial [Salmonella enterica]|nr:hypothetical protein [Salmonella enterica]
EDILTAESLMDERSWLVEWARGVFDRCGLQGAADTESALAMVGVAVLVSVAVCALLRLVLVRVAPLVRRARGGRESVILGRSVLRQAALVACAFLLLAFGRAMGAGNGLAGRT